MVWKCSRALHSARDAPGDAGSATRAVVPAPGREGPSAGLRRSGRPVVRFRAIVDPARPYAYRGTTALRCGSCGHRAFHAANPKGLMMANAKIVLGSLDQELAWQRDLYKDLHRNPELSLEEHRRQIGSRRGSPASGTRCSASAAPASSASWPTGDGPAVLARADMDALPVTEATGLPYASEGGRRHARVRARRARQRAARGREAAWRTAAKRWSGTYIALFQPAEEVGAGSKAMVDDGLVAKVPRPDVALAQHVMPFAAGTVGHHSRPGPVGRRFAQGHRPRQGRARLDAAPVRGPGGAGRLDRAAGCRPSSRARRSPASSPSSPSARSTPARSRTSSRTAPRCC